MHKTLTKQILYGAAVKRFTMICAIVCTLLCIVAIVFTILPFFDNEIPVAEAVLVPLVMCLSAFIFTFFIVVLAKRGIMRFITKQERNRQCDDIVKVTTKNPGVSVVILITGKQSQRTVYYKTTANSLMHSQLIFLTANGNKPTMPYAKTPLPWNG